MKRDRKPPAFAAWMLPQVLRGPRREALVGDLAEEYRHGRSRAWYWLQALYAIAADVREHPPSRFALGALRLLAIAGLIVAASFDAKWPLFILALDPSWPLLVRWHRRHRTARRQAPCDP